MQRRVLLVTDSLVNGGLERQLSLLARALPTQWEVRVVSLGDGIYRQVLCDAGVYVDVLSRRFRLDVTPLLGLRRIVRSWSPDVVHTWGWMSTAASLVVCAHRGIPVIDGSIRTGRVPPRRGVVQRATLTRAAMVIANSQAGLDVFGIGAERGRVVHNGFDPARWELCAAAESIPKRFTVVMTGRMERDKDYALLFAAARLLDSLEPGLWSFVAVGAGQDRECLIRESTDLVAAGLLSFPEAGTEVLPIVCTAQAGVLLSNPHFAAEGISNSIMEYMACGLPVVCTDSGGNVELVIEGQTGFVIPASDPMALVAALRSLRQGPELARRMGRAGRERIQAEFSVGALVSQTIEVYETALGQLCDTLGISSEGRNK